MKRKYSHEQDSEAATTAIRQSAFLQMPDDIRYLIARYLHDEDILSLYSTCRSMQATFFKFRRHHTVLQHGSHFDRFLHAAMTSKDLSLAHLDVRGFPGCLHLSCEDFDEDEDELNRFNQIRHLTIRSTAEDEDFDPQPEITQFCMERNNMVREKPARPDTLALWIDRVSHDGKLGRCDDDRIIIATSFLPHLESLHLYYPHHEVTSFQYLCILKWTYQLKSLKIYTRNLDVDDLGMFFQLFPVLEEVEVSNLSCNHDWVDYQSKHLAEQLLSHPNMSHLTIVRSAESLDDFRDQDLVRFPPVEEYIFQEITRQSKESGVPGTLQTLELRNQKLKRSTIADLLSSSATAGLKRLAVKSQTRGNDTIDQIEVLDNQPCFWNASTSLRLECGLAQFSLDTYKIIGARIHTLQLWQSLQSEADYAIIISAVNEGCFPNLKRLHMLPRFSVYDEFVSFISALRQSLQAKSPGVELVNGDEDEDYYHEYIKGLGWGKAAEPSSTDEQEEDEEEDYAEEWNEEGGGEQIERHGEDVP